MTTDTVYSHAWSKRTSKQGLLTLFAWVLLLAFISWAFQIMTEDTIWEFVTDAPNRALDIGSRMVPPDWFSINDLWWALWETLNIATLGTALGTVMAVPVAFLAARNTTPSTRFLRPLALFIIVA